MIVILKDGVSFYATREAVESIKRLVGDPSNRLIDLSSLHVGLDSIAPGDIRRIEEGGEPPIDRGHRITAKIQKTPAEMEAQRIRNLKNFDMIRADLTHKRVFRTKNLETE